MNFSMKYSIILLFVKSSSFLITDPQLEKFYLKNYECIDCENESSIVFSKLNQFNSSFWIERQWLFEAEIMMYSIRSYKYI
jgi:hypothetical protein